MSPTKMKNNRVAGTQSRRNASPLFLPERIRRRAESAKSTSIAAPEEARIAIQIGYTRDGHGAYIAASARNMTIGETRFPTAIQGKTVTPPRNVRVARAFIRTEPCVAKN